MEIEKTKDLLEDVVKKELEKVQSGVSGDSKDAMQCVDRYAEILKIQNTSEEIELKKQIAENEYNRSQDEEKFKKKSKIFDVVVKAVEISVVAFTTLYVVHKEAAFRNEAIDKIQKFEGDGYVPSTTAGRGVFKDVIGKFKK